MAEFVFEWDQWNVQKNEDKHGVSRLEAESAFYDPRHRLFQDLRHPSARETRYILYGRSLEVRLYKFIRGQVAYAGSVALIAQIAADVTETREWATTR